MKRITMSDVARAAGVGVATVDRVINKRARVKADTAKKVLEAAEQLGFSATNLIRLRVDERSREYRLGFILQKRSAPFYQALAKSLQDAARQAGAAKALVDYPQDLTPEQVAAKIEELGERVDALAIVTADHPRVSQALEAVAAKGVAVVTLISDLTTQARTAFVGIDNRLVGRTAGWAIARLSKTPGKVGILLGSHRYLCQELCEISFRSYFREKHPEFELLESILCLEEAGVAREAAQELIRQHPDLVGIYVVGGGIEGVEKVLAEPLPRHIVTVCHELTELSRTALRENRLDLVISHPRARLAEEAVRAMLQAIEARSSGAPRHILLPFDISTPENAVL